MVNKQAHEAGAAHAERVKARMLAELAAQACNLPTMDEAFGDLPTINTAALPSADEVLDMYASDRPPEEPLHH